MKVNVNNSPVETEAAMLSDLIAQLNLPATGIAVGMSGRMVSREAWAATPLTEGANIVIVKAACGG